MFLPADFVSCPSFCFHLAHLLSSFAQGVKLSWVGAGRDTFSSALAVMLRESGLHIKGLDFSASASNSAEAARQLRLHILRFIAANQHRLKALSGPDQQLHAAALCFRVHITCLQVTAPCSCPALSCRSPFHRALCSSGFVSRSPLRRAANTVPVAGDRGRGADPASLRARARRQA